MTAALVIIAATVTLLAGTMFIDRHFSEPQRAKRRRKELWKAGGGRR